MPFKGTPVPERIIPAPTVVPFIISRDNDILTVIQDTIATETLTDFLEPDITTIQERPNREAALNLTPQTEIVTLVDAGPAFRGPQGPSLYDLWIEAGHTGSLNDFLATFQGGGSLNPVSVQLSYALSGVSSYVATHGLSKIPRVTLLTSTGEEVETDVIHVPGRTTLIFPVPFTGTLYLE